TGSTVAAGERDAFRRYADRRARPDARAILRASERRCGLCPGLLPRGYGRGTVADSSAQRAAPLAAANASTEPSRGCMTPIMLPSESLNHAALRSPASKTPSTVFIVG